MNNFSRYTVFIFLGFLIALVGLFGLSNMFSVKSTTSETRAPLTSPDSQATTSAVATGDVAQRMLVLAKQEVKKLTGLNPNQIEVLKQDEVEWPNSALGCPKPGFMYTQQVVPGFNIILQTTDETFEFHTDTTSDVLLCQSKVLEE